MKTILLFCFILNADVLIFFVQERHW